MGIMMINSNPKSRETNLVTQNLESETLIYDLLTNQVYSLNKTSSLVWQSCDGNNSVSDISDLLSKRLKTLVSEDFILLALSELHKNNLLETETGEYFANLNRREMVKRVGLASMIALPFISSVTAPTAANAASACLGNNAPITCEVTLQNIFVTCFQALGLGANAWRCANSQCCAGTCVNLDPATFGTNGACS